MGEPAKEPQKDLIDLIPGVEITLRTSFDEEISGTVSGYDRGTDSLLLKQPGSHGGVTTLRIIRGQFVKEILSAVRPAEPVVVGPLPPVDLDRAQQRLDKALRQAELGASKMGAGVTQEAQALFDALAKTMPCRWEEKTIVVLEEVWIKSPYIIQDCDTRDNLHMSTLERVKKVLSAERQRLGLG